MSKEMLNAIDGEEFGPALDILMDKHICNYTARLLRSITGLDNRTISNMKKGENLTKSKHSNIQDVPVPEQDYLYGQAPYYP